MELHSFFNSSASYRVRIALALKGVPYRYLPVNIRTGEQKDPSYLTVNPIGLVPALTGIPEGSIGQSLAIIDYLDRTYPQAPLLPSSNRERARVLEIVYAICCDIHPLNNLRTLRYLTDVLKATEEQKKGWYDHWIAEGMAAVEVILERAGSARFCVGDAPTLADCCLIPQWANALRMGCDLSPYPRCRAVYENCMSLPAFAAAAPESQPDYIPPSPVAK